MIFFFIHIINLPTSFSFFLRFAIYFSHSFASAFIHSLIFSISLHSRHSFLKCNPFLFLPSFLHSFVY